eukprot:TRINITY_DN88875_c0_g1_i1.p1 TRINITY_DN88875_c0_g1~~TRINITY_DN88875_c0_g1_i1.p1  ORF type:complete len:414 (+),score=56.63 TRINITY_DN88875_c0_g1_i1:92-1243(+)
MAATAVCSRPLLRLQPRRFHSFAVGVPPSLQGTEVRGSLPSNPKTKILGTHDGTFHCDEACAISLLKMLPAFEDAVVVRSRDHDVLKGCDIVVDVGGVYKHSSGRYDHHQRNFNGTMDELGRITKLSSFGLVYRHFGLEMVQRVVDTTVDITHAADSSVADIDLDAIYHKLYVNFVEHIDGIDNGIDMFEGGGVLNYEVTTTLSDRVSALNPSWNEQAGPSEMNERFSSALALCGSELALRTASLVQSWWPARALVRRALLEAAQVHPSRQILCLEQYCPWVSHLFDLEEELSNAGNTGVVGAAKYVVFKDSRSPEWRIKAVPVAPGSFASRLPLPESWRGLHGDSLSQLTGIQGCVFVHSSGFIGGHVSRDGALALALKAIS